MTIISIRTGQIITMLLLKRASSFASHALRRATHSASTTSSIVSTINDAATTSAIDLFQPFFPILYNDVYEVPLPPNHRFPMEKYRKVRERVQHAIQSHLPHDAGKVQYEFAVSPLVTVQDLETTHCPDYIQRYLDGNQTKEELRNVGFPWSPMGVDRSSSSTGGTVAAATLLCKVKRKQKAYLQDVAKHMDDKSEMNEAKMGLLFSAHVAGGTHHAFRDRGEGFCVFSDIAVAANVLLRDFPDLVKKILIIDLDVHQGNGNAVLFQGIEEVKTFSMHCNANYFSAKQDSDLDIELPPETTDATYLATLHHWLNRFRRGDAGELDFIFFQAGVDILEDDRLGRMSISQEGIARRNEMVFDLAKDLKVPLCITMGGGYPKRDWEPILKAHANVYIQAFEYLVDHCNK
jgi:acetoin utilization deacetylase AcuC-like enzyme